MWSVARALDYDLRVSDTAALMPHAEGLEREIRNTAHTIMRQPIPHPVEPGGTEAADKLQLAQLHLLAHLGGMHVISPTHKADAVRIAVYAKN